jgi:hypothetical protein
VIPKRDWRDEVTFIFGSMPSFIDDMYLMGSWSDQLFGLPSINPPVSHGNSCNSFGIGNEASPIDGSRDLITLLEISRELLVECERPFDCDELLLVAFGPVGTLDGMFGCFEVGDIADGSEHVDIGVGEEGIFFGGIAKKDRFPSTCILFDDGVTLNDGLVTYGDASRKGLMRDSEKVSFFILLISACLTDVDGLIQP